MKLADVFAAVGSLLRGDRVLLLPVAGLFYFLPSLALLLMLPDGPVAGANGDAAALERLTAYARENAAPILAANVVQLAGAAILFALFAAPGRPTLGEAIGVAARRFIPFAGATILCWAAMTLGALLIVPALYLIGRLFLVGAVAVGEGRGPIASIVRSVELTDRRGWWCFAAAAVPFFAGQVIVSIAGGFDGAMRAAGAESAALHLIFNAVAAAGATAAWAAALLAKVVVYRRLTKGT